MKISEIIKVLESAKTECNEHHKMISGESCKGHKTCKYRKDISSAITTLEHLKERQRVHIITKDKSTWPPDGEEVLVYNSEDDFYYVDTFSNDGFGMKWKYIDWSEE